MSNQKRTKNYGLGKKVGLPIRVLWGLNKALKKEATGSVQNSQNPREKYLKLNQESAPSLRSQGQAPRETRMSHGSKRFMPNKDGK